MTMIFFNTNNIKKLCNKGITKFKNYLKDLKSIEKLTKYVARNMYKLAITQDSKYPQKYLQQLYSLFSEHSLFKLILASY